MKAFYIKNKKKINQAASVAVVVALVAALPVWGDTQQAGWGKNMLVFATTAEDIKHQAEQDLENVNNNISDIEDEQENVNNKLANAAIELDNLIAQQQVLKGNIEAKQAEVEQANIDLAAAREKEKEEYESMKLRIQFMYENNTDESFWTAILTANGLSDMLTRVEYISQVYKADRKGCRGQEHFACQ